MASGDRADRTVAQRGVEASLVEAAEPGEVSLGIVGNVFGLRPRDVAIGLDDGNRV